MDGAERERAEERSYISKGRGEQSATTNNNKRAPPQTRVTACPRDERVPHPRVDATAGGEQGDGP